LTSICAAALSWSRSPDAADFAVGAALPYAEAARIPLEGFAEIARWKARLDALPAWSDPYPPRLREPTFPVGV